MAPICIEYVWIGSTGEILSRTRVSDFAPESISDVPGLALDGSSNGMDCDESGDVYLQPRSMFSDPFRGGEHLLVLCDSFVTEVAAIDSTSGILIRPLGTRAACADVIGKAESAGANPFFGCEQEYFSGHWPHENMSNPASPLITPNANQADETTALKLRSKSRKLAERHLRTCLQAGIEVVEVSEVPSHSSAQANNRGSCWSYKIASNKGLELADQLWMSRFLMLRLSDEEGVPVSFNPRTAGQQHARCFVECSNERTRNPQYGLSNIQVEIERLGSWHHQHLMVYGTTPQAATDFAVNAPGGKHSSSIYVPKNTLVHNSGFYIDCRPLSDSDPYLVVMMLASSTLMIPLPAPCQLVTFQVPKPSYLNSQALRSSSLTKQNLTSSLSCSSMVDDDDCSMMNSEAILLDELDRLDSGDSSQSRLESFDECQDLLSSIDGDIDEFCYDSDSDHDSDSDSTGTSPRAK